MPIKAITHHRLKIVTSAPTGAPDVAFALGFAPKQSVYRVQDCAEAVRDPDQVVLFDVNLSDPSVVATVRAALSVDPETRARTIFLVDGDKRSLRLQAMQLGADSVLGRPIRAEKLRSVVLRLMLPRVRRAQSHAAELAVETSDAVLRTVFQITARPEAVDSRKLAQDAAGLVGAFDELGLDAWLEAVRVHHSGTFQHCLLVTGVAIAFGRHLGLRDDDVQRLALGGILHDLGKAMIPVEILDKPGRLTEEEEAVMRQHPRIGQSALLAAGGFAPELIDVVAHHHEFLDGTGYPDGLGAAHISDLVRIMTISDIYGALVERRAYKEPLTPEAACGVLRSLRGKLEGPLLDVFIPMVLGPSTRLRVAG